MGNQGSHQREQETLASTDSNVRSLTQDLDRLQVTISTIFNRTMTLQITEVVELFKEGQYGRNLKRHDFDKISKLTSGKLTQPKPCF